MYNLHDACLCCRCEESDRRSNPGRTILCHFQRTTTQYSTNDSSSLPICKFCVLGGWKFHITLRAVITQDNFYRLKLFTDWLRISEYKTTLKPCTVVLAYGAVSSQRSMPSSICPGSCGGRLDQPKKYLLFLFQLRFASMHFVIR